MRRYLSIVEGSSNEIDTEIEMLFLDRMLVESVLTEGAVADRIKAAMAKVAQKFGKPTPQVLDQVANRADSLFSRDEEVSRVIAYAKKLGRSPALLGAMVGICGALISLSPNSAAAQDAAGKLQPILALQDVQQITDALAQHGIKVQSTSTTQVALPSTLSPAQVAAAKALKAVNDFEIENGRVISSYRSYGNSLTIEGNVEKSGTRYDEIVQMWTPDHTMLLAEFHTQFEVQNGQPAIVGDTTEGVKFDLARVFDGLNQQSMQEVDAFITQNGGRFVKEAAGGEGIAQMIQARAPAICMTVALLAVRKGSIARRVRISAQGAQTGGAVSETRVPSRDSIAEMAYDDHLRDDRLSGEIDNAARNIFSMGGCHILAVAIHDETGWPIVGVTDPDNVFGDRLGGGSCVHYCVKAPDGKLIDIDGAHTEEDLRDRFYGDVDENEDGEPIPAIGITSRADALEWWAEQGKKISLKAASKYVPAVLAQAGYGG